MYSMSADLLNMRCELWDRDGGARSRPHTAREIMHIAISEGSFWARASRDRDERRDPAGAAARTSTRRRTRTRHSTHVAPRPKDRALCTGVIAYSRYHAVWGGGRRAAQTATTTATPPGQRRGPRRHWRGAGGRRAGTRAPATDSRGNVDTCSCKHSVVRWNDSSC